MSLRDQVHSVKTWTSALVREDFRPSFKKCEYCGKRRGNYHRPETNECYCLRCGFGRLHYDTKCRMPEIFGREPAPSIPVEFRSSSAAKEFE